VDDLATIIAYIKIEIVYWNINMCNACYWWSIGGSCQTWYMFLFMRWVVFSSHLVCLEADVSTVLTQG